jgi:signal transduction histidine kinase
LEFAAQTGRETLTVLQQLVAVMRTAELEDDQPLHARLEELAAGFTRLGLAVTVEVEPEPTAGRPVAPETVEEVVYAVAREALTNVVRYAPGAATRLLVRHRGDMLELLVENDAASTSSTVGPLGSGRGLVGARERTAAVGGTLTAGPRPGGGWVVHAVLPVQAGATAVPRRRWDWGTVQRVVDVAIVLILGLFPAIGLIGAERALLVEHGPVLALVILLTLAHAVPLLFRRRAPWLALGAMFAITWLVAIAIGFSLLPKELLFALPVMWAGEVVAVHAVAAYGRRGWPAWSAVPATAIALIGPPVLAASADGSLAGEPVAPGIVIQVVVLGLILLAPPLVLTWVIGYARRIRRDRTLAREDSALAVAADEALAAAHAERRRIAGELHSTVLDRAARVVTVAEEGRLDGVVAEARATLAAMRDLLGNLRAEQAEPADQRAPQPTTANLDQLCTEYSAAGRDVMLDRPSEAPALAADVELSAYRVVEAALAAGDTEPAHVHLDYRSDELRLTITGVPSAVAGPTMARLQTRVAAAGGRLDADGGTVQAWLPLRTVAPVPGPA